MKNFRIVAAVTASAALATAGIALRQVDRPVPVSTGKIITPVGPATGVGSFPANMILSPNGQYVIVTNTGFREQLSVLDAATGKLVNRVEFNEGRRGDKDALYYGLTFLKTGVGDTILAASRGGQDMVTLFKLGDDGTLTEIRDVDLPAANNPQHIPNFVAGLATPDDSTILAVGNQSHAFNDWHGSLFALGPDGVNVQYKVGNFPLAVAAMHSQRRAYVSNENDGTVSVVNLGGDAANAQPVQAIRTGDHPTGLLLNKAETRLYVANSDSDTVSVIDTASNRVARTILLRPGAIGGLPGFSPLGLALSPDEKTLFVTMADLNAVAVVDAQKGDLRGYVPTGWYPTSAVVTPDGKRLFVSNAKGDQARVPNNKDVNGWGQYSPNILEGTVSMLDVDNVLAHLPETTRQVMANNFAATPSGAGFRNPGIKHVFYIIKENRTYDQVFGDVKKGNGDPSICMFPRAVTPNQHALVERFALLDNFYTNAEVSAQGWTWSTSGMANEYVERNVPHNYSGRGRAYDEEGTNNAVPVEVRGLKDVSTSPGGYLWDQCARQHVSLRNYGMYIAEPSRIKGPDGKPLAEEQEPTKIPLLHTTNRDFRGFDLSFADSEAWVKYGLPPAPKQMTTYGSHRDPSRLTTWLRDFDGYVKNHDLPQLNLLRLGRDHTSGTAAGQYSPRAMVADNDYAVAQVVDAISHSPYWSSSAIFIVEDDSQNGFDHVDCHRSTGYVISPFVKRGIRDSRFYNSDSFLHTMALLLGLKPWNQYVATAAPLDVFDSKPSNIEPYSAVLPAKEIVGEINRRDAYRAKDSAKIARFDEDSIADIELNDILWGAIKGAKTPRPHVPNALWQDPTKGKDRDGD